MKNIYKIFTPFFKVDKQTTFIIMGVWLAIFLFFWCSAPALIPGPITVFNQVITYLNPGMPSPSIDTIFPYIHPNFPNLDFYYDIFASLELTITAMLISILIACITAYSSTIAAFNFPGKVIMMLRFMSLLGFLFLFMSLLGGNASKLKNTLLIFSIVPYFTLSLVSVINKIDQQEYDLWTTLRYNKWEQLWEIVIVGKADSVIEAIISNFSMGWVMMTIAETKSMADGGLGVQLFNADKYNHLTQVFAIQVIIYLIGYIIMFLLKKWKAKQFPYTIN